MNNFSRPLRPGPSLTSVTVAERQRVKAPSPVGGGGGLDAGRRQRGGVIRRDGRWTTKDSRPGPPSAREEPDAHDWKPEDGREGQVVKYKGVAVLDAKGSSDIRRKRRERNRLAWGRQFLCREGKGGRNKPVGVRQRV